MSASKRARSRGSKGRGPSSSAGKGGGTSRSGGANAKGSGGVAAPEKPPTTLNTATAAGPGEVPVAATPTTTEHTGATARSRPRATRVVVRRVDPRSALKVSALFYLSLSIAMFVAAILLWIGANAVGLVGNIEAFMDEIGFTDFQLRAGQVLKAWLITAIVFTVAGSLANFLMAVLYNLISETIGGVKVVLGDDRSESTRA